jgi:hypothetical protein
MRTVAIDWSGRALNARRTIWIAEAADEGLVFLENGRGRLEVGQLLVDWAMVSPDLIVGLDFAFSFPAWFLDEMGVSSAHDLWVAAASKGDEWLAACESPFWGRPGKPRPDLAGRAHYRATDAGVPATAGIRPKSVFQIGGAGAVGTASIRGMPILNRLSRAGFSIWPFDPPGLPQVIEIYPRLLSGPVLKSSQRSREACLSAKGVGGKSELWARAASTEDAFDAAISAVVMREHLTELRRLPQVDDQVARLEGTIWHV